MAKRKPRSIVIGSFLDPVRQIWSPNARAFETVRDVVDYLGMKDAYYDDLAYELRVKKEELYDALDRIDPALAMEALIRVLQMNPGTAIKPFRTYREAEAFLAFIEQIAEQDEKEDLPDQQKDRRVFQQIQAIDPAVFPVGAADNVGADRLALRHQPRNAQRVLLSHASAPLPLSLYRNAARNNSAK